MECVVSLHRLMMQETGQLVRTGIHPTGLDPEIQTTPSGSGAPFITYTSAIPDAMPSGTECLIEKVAQLAKEVDGVVNRLAVPYVGPRTFLRFIECFCEFFKRRKAEIQATKNALRLGVCEFVGVCVCVCVCVHTCRCRLCDVYGLNMLSPYILCVFMYVCVHAFVICVGVCITLVVLNACGLHTL